MIFLMIVLIVNFEKKSADDQKMSPLANSCFVQRDEGLTVLCNS